ncbi:MAG: hypothetical protein PHW79_07505 [Candidatus Marinimicrobia bacterium]|nr:hypothetical protein [Candidatus Neomarinimicrobiota bacterium]
MKEVVEEILEEEKKAREMVVSAQQKADLDLKKSKDEARHLIESTRQNALSESEEIINRSEKSAQEEKTARLAKIKVESEQTLIRMKPQVANAAERLYKTIIGEITSTK